MGTNNYKHTTYNFKKIKKWMWSCQWTLKKKTISKGNTPITMRNLKPSNFKTDISPRYNSQFLMQILLKNKNYKMQSVRQQTYSSIKKLTSVIVMNSNLCQHCVVLYLRLPKRRTVVGNDDQLPYQEQYSHSFDEFSTNWNQEDDKTELRNWLSLKHNSITHN